MPKHESWCQVFDDDGPCDCPVHLIKEDRLNDALDLMSPAEIRELALEQLRAQAAR